eukprot:scaffold24739_cov97-Isochrysis_galbana.AAC.1
MDSDARHPLHGVDDGSHGQLVAAQEVAGEEDAPQPVHLRVEVGNLRQVLRNHHHERLAHVVVVCCGRLVALSVCVVDGWGVRGESRGRGVRSWGLRHIARGRERMYVREGSGVGGGWPLWCPGGGCERLAVRGRDIADQHVHVARVATLGHLHRLAEGVDFGEQPAQAQKRAAAECRARDALVLRLGRHLRAAAAGREGIG